jgi:hypothetical protein
VVAMKACSNAHYRAREIAELGHSVRLIPWPDPPKSWGRSCAS